MALQHFFKSIFSRSQTPTLLDEGIWKSSLQVADDYIRKRKDVEVNRRFHIAMAFASALIHMADRIAFETIPAKRAEVMDRLMIGVALRAAEEAIGLGAESGSKERLVESALTEINQATQFYGQCKKVSAEHDEPMKGTFLWEFGKRFAEATNHPMDIAFVTVGPRILVQLATAIKLPQRVISY